MGVDYVFLCGYFFGVIFWEDVVVDVVVDFVFVSGEDVIVGWVEVEVVVLDVVVLVWVDGLYLVDFFGVVVDEFVVMMELVWICGM